MHAKNTLITLTTLAAVAVGVSGCSGLDSSGPHAFTTKNQHHATQKADGGSTKVAKPKPKPDPLAGLTEAQKQAVGSAQDYLDYSHFSRLGLISQLSSKYGEGFTQKEAIFAVDHIKVDWNKQAVGAAKDYLKTSHFSRAGLISQLDSKYGEQFTVAQATYAANHVGL